VRPTHRYRYNFKSLMVRLDLCPGCTRHISINFGAWDAPYACFLDSGAVRSPRFILDEPTPLMALRLL